jgi:hypothetical protein
MVFPQRRGEVEAFDTDVRDITTDPELTRQFTIWRDSRERHLGQALVAQRMFGLDVADEMGYQRHYFTGTSPGGASAPVHQQKLSLCPFHNAGARDVPQPPTNGSKAPPPADDSAPSSGNDNGRG